jgi:hypothetical protein
VATYVGEVPPQQDEDISEVDELSHVKRLGMPDRTDHRFRQQVANQICALMAHHRVVPVHAREIMQDPKLKPIWVSLPHDMTLLMCHVVGALKQLERLRYCHQYYSSNLFVEDDDPSPPPPPPSPPQVDWPTSPPQEDQKPYPSLVID